MVAVAAPPVLGRVNILSHHNDNRRTGVNLQEKQLTVANVKKKI